MKIFLRPRNIKMFSSIAADYGITTDQVINYVLNDQEISLNEEQISYELEKEDVEDGLIRMFARTLSMYFRKDTGEYEDANSVMVDLYMVKSLFGDNVLFDTICRLHGLPFEPFTSPLCLYDDFYGINDIFSYLDNVPWPDEYRSPSGDKLRKLLREGEDVYIEDYVDFPIYGRAPAYVDEVGDIAVIRTRIPIEEDINTFLREARLPDDGLRRVYANYLNSLDVEKEWPAMATPAA